MNRNGFTFKKRIIICFKTIRKNIACDEEIGVLSSPLVWCMYTYSHTHTNISHMPPILTCFAASHVLRCTRYESAVNRDAPPSDANPVEADGGNVGYYCHLRALG